MACHVIPAPGRLVDVGILELPVSSRSGVGISCTSMRLGRQMVKELDLKLTLGMTGRRKTEDGVSGSYLGLAQSHPLSESSCFCRIGHSIGCS